MTHVVTPELVTVIREAIRAELGRARVELPARVERFDASDNTVDVQPLVRERVLEDGEFVARALPVLPRVPVAYMRWNGFVLRCPVAVGDIVSLRFQDRDLETWMSGSGAEVTPKSRRAHALDDAVAVPAPAPYAKAIAGLSDGALVMGREDGAGEVRVEVDGAMKIGPAAGSFASAAREGDATVVDATSDSAWVQYLIALHGAVVSLAGGVGSTPVAAAFAGANPSPPTTITGRVNAGSPTVEVA